ncbi:MAG: hypothetical protein F2840_05205 [Actinobacteria bacterium]|nr:hypothetical protein [Actinomycetota bacterium]
MPTRRVVQWGTGAVGLRSLQFVLASNDLELVGVKCFTEAKEGKDAGHLASRPSTNILATADTDALLALDADCVLFMPRDTFLDPTLPGSPSRPWVDELVAILESGKNVVSPLQSAMHWRHLSAGAALRDRLEAACQRGGASLFFTGLDPGFVSDCLAITLSSAAGEITQIRTTEVINYATYAAPSVLESMGFGLKVEQLSSAANDSLVPSWGCALWLVSDALGVELDDIVLATDAYPSPVDFTSPGGLHVAVGAVGALQWSLTGMVGGQARIVSHHVSRMGDDMAPDWPRIGEKGGYRVEIDGTPPLRAELPLGLAGGTGTCLDDAIVMTAARCVNAINAVVEAPPGYHLLNAMRTIGGRHSLAR